MSATSTNNTYLADAPVEADKIDTWVEQFHRDGYLFLTDVLSPPVTAQLRDDLDEALADGGVELQGREHDAGKPSCPSTWTRQV